MKLPTGGTYAAIAEETPKAEPVRPDPSPFALLAAGEADAFDATGHWLDG